MTLLPTETVSLIQKSQTSTDDFGAPIYSESEIAIDGACVYPTSSEDMTDTLNLTGKKSVYTVCIPKGDANNWTNTKVMIRGEAFKTIGAPISWTETPLEWNKRIEVERYE